MLVVEHRIAEQTYHAYINMLRVDIKRRSYRLIPERRRRNALNNATVSVSDAE